MTDFNVFSLSDIRKGKHRSHGLSKKEIKNKRPMGHYAHQSSGGHFPLTAMYFYKPWQSQAKDATDEIWTQLA